MFRMLTAAVATDNRGSAAGRRGMAKRLQADGRDEQLDFPLKKKKKQEKESTEHIFKGGKKRSYWMRAPMTSPPPPHPSNRVA